MILYFFILDFIHRLLRVSEVP